MSTVKPPNSEGTFVIESAVRDDGSVTVREAGTTTTHHVVDYADSLVREKLAARPVGTTVRLALAPADPTGQEWIATRIKPGAPLGLGP
ncbi:MULTISPECIES: hypothetical protein [Halomicrobium]|uniref:DUF7999 domain-containing protein n=2 Tax=Halomicrobium mukohataei TaxID=57705 RepID=C7P2N7_HALMD|nr:MULTISPECIES: hypothetical protein [Halomicrobium]ACV47359.1 hypothetical protein Hmuk_1237 [Halomicrobium mukohataei DSM 12286]QCD65826.1 hypothetical protein E5139_09360 [Halomicrobium mukohataei]QFR20631.1 hypothetical protein GBQ70_09355 [Halomicrobium sp. ZPS1]